MNRWLVKSDPDEYSAHDLERDGKSDWSGVRNPAAQGHLRAMQPGDGVLVYHTGKERAVVATATVASAPRPDPGDKTGKSVTVDLAFDAWLKGVVPLAAFKVEPAFKEFALVRIGRLSVMPVTADQWKRTLKMAGGTR